ncbi:PREDICTED: skin secretory protein xP2-like [Priapulus caudatus]|uniref:Skin secretory protein xP2-like n=1 Tax=Priapulus caudatus TaxID=37621 RepID=A0ABM1DVH9_PRICU|nr:PREDICTED: skin secretory protein xP2-like [Priapulus caudatus]
MHVDVAPSPQPRMERAARQPATPRDTQAPSPATPAVAWRPTPAHAQWTRRPHQQRRGRGASPQPRSDATPSPQTYPAHLPVDVGASYAQPTPSRADAGASPGRHHATQPGALTPDRACGRGALTPAANSNERGAPHPSTCGTRRLGPSRAWTRALAPRRTRGRGAPRPSHAVRRWRLLSPARAWPAVSVDAAPLTQPRMDAGALAPSPRSGRGASAPHNAACTPAAAHRACAWTRHPHQRVDRGTLTAARGRGALPRPSRRDAGTLTQPRGDAGTLTPGRALWTQGTSPQLRTGRGRPHPSRGGAHLAPAAAPDAAPSPQRALVDAGALTQTTHGTRPPSPSRAWTRASPPARMRDAAPLTPATHGRGAPSPSSAVGRGALTPSGGRRHPHPSHAWTRHPHPSHACDAGHPHPAHRMGRGTLTPATARNGRGALTPATPVERGASPQHAMDAAPSPQPRMDAAPSPQPRMDAAPHPSHAMDAGASSAQSRARKRGALT